MADTAYRTRYREEFVAGFEQRSSLLVKACTTEAQIDGTSAVFLVADSGDETAVTRGTNGLIPAKADVLVQNTATLAEWHDLRRRSRFNIFMSQGDGARIMQENNMAVLNRKRDTDILAALETGTQDTSTTGQTASINMAAHALAILGNNAVDVADGNVTWVISPAAFSYLIQTGELSNKDFASVQPFSGVRMHFNWLGLNVIVHPNLTGKATASEKNIMFHKSAIGHACDKENLDVQIGYDAEQDYSWSRASGFFGSKLLQNEGVVITLSDGSGFASV